MTDETTEVKPVTDDSAGGSKNIDWNAAEKYYLDPNPDGTLKSYQDVAVKFGCTKTRVEQVGRERNWVELRQNLGEQGLEEYRKNRIEEQGRAETRHLGIWRGIQQTALLLLKDLRKDVEDMRAGKPINAITKANPSTQLKDIVSTLDTSINGERIALGLPTTVSKSDVTSSGRPVALSPELIAEIDAMYRKNGDTTANPTTELPSAANQ